jgi:hypothetical protein
VWRIGFIDPRVRNSVQSYSIIPERLVTRNMHFVSMKVIRTIVNLFPNHEIIWHEECIMVSGLCL